MVANSGSIQSALPGFQTIMEGEIPPVLDCARNKPYSGTRIKNVRIWARWGVMNEMNPTSMKEKNLGSL